MLTTIIGRAGSRLTASMRGKAFRAAALVGTLVATSVAVNSLLILVDGHLR